MSHIDFYFDFSSPYGYFGSTQIDELAAKYDREVDWHPYLVGTAMKQTGHQPLFHTPMFHDYVMVDVPRFARLLDVSFVLPNSFPLVASEASRAYYWIQERDGALAKQFARRTYHAFFGEGRDISKTEELKRVAAECDIDGEELATATRNPRLKDAFREKNNKALEKGVFGSPFVIVDGQPFWGADRFYQVERWLETGGW